MKQILKALCMLPVLAACTEMTVSVINPQDVDRLPEMVEINAADVVSALQLAEGDTFVIECDGKEVPYQLTYDGKVIYQVDLGPADTLNFVFSKGVPAQVDTIACGRQYPERMDDFAWENDKVGFRAYGPALQKRGDKAFGYDLFAKRGTHKPVLAEMYAKETSPAGKEKYRKMKETDPVAADRFLYDSLSYHIDRGYGMDVYQVGPTLGAGVAALVENGQIVYPWCYDSYEILENGPLRMTFKLKFTPLQVGESNDVIETRVISIDAGSHLNKTVISYANLKEEKRITTGIVLQDKDGREVKNQEKGFIAYPAPSINMDKTREVDNGTHFVGHVFPFDPQCMETVYFSNEESAQRNNSKGHVLAYGKYVPETDFVYYWGFGWDHSDMPSYEEWLKYLGQFSDQLRNPLVVIIK